MSAITNRLTTLSLLRSLGHRPFALLWCGQTLSRIGDFLYEIALAWWVLQQTGSPAAMAGVLIFAFTPMVLFLLIGGVAVDRFPRVRLMLASDVSRGVVMVAVAGLAFSDSLQLWQVYVASLVFGFLDAFFQPAYAALVPEITPAEDLPSANSLTSFSLQLGRIVGPALGAAIVSLGGTPTAFALNGLTFFVSAAFLAPLAGLPLPTPPRERSESTSVIRDAREGIAIVLRTPWLWISIAVFALSNVTLAGPYSVAMPFLVKDHLHIDVAALGALYAIFPIGYVIGGVWLGRKSTIRRRGLLMYGGLMVAGLMLALFGLQVPFALGVTLWVAALGVAALINGAALEIGNLAWTNVLQEFVPGDKLGRVSSIDMLGSFVLLPVGFGLTGWVTEQLGPALVFVIGGGLTALLALLALAHQKVRCLD